MFKPLEREPCANEGAFNTVLARDTQASVVKKGALALRCNKEVIAAWVKDDRLGNLALVHQCNGDRINRHAVDEVCGAIEGVNDPDEFRRVVLINLACCTTGESRLFAKKAVAGEGLHKRLDNDPLTGFIHFRDKIVFVFLTNSNTVDVKACAINQRASLACGFHRNIEHWMHKSEFSKSNT